MTHAPTHILKCRTLAFQAVIEKRKTHDIRSTLDCEYAVGDVLHYQEWDDATSSYTGRNAWVAVTYVDQFSTDAVALSIHLSHFTDRPPSGHYMKTESL